MKPENISYYEKVISKFYFWVEDNSSFYFILELDSI
jgi:hypothetical protein